MTDHTFQTDRPVHLVTEIGKGSVSITATETATTTVEVTGRDADQVEVRQDGDRVSVIGPKQWGFFGADHGVDVRLDGRELAFVVHEAPVPAAAAAPAQPADEETEDDGTVARITLRIPESVKTRAEELAARSGSSLNTWLVNVVRAATREGAVNVDIDLSSIPFLGGGPDPFTAKRGNRRMTGWV